MLFGIAESKLIEIQYTMFTNINDHLTTLIYFLPMDLLVLKISTKNYHCSVGDILVAIRIWIVYL